ncbi:dihydrofolate reductase family protein, partial [Stenotrophomonas maltophilia]|uniref:dihydrofolate reductase family protein n=1 Tax=Stenotrophomonas maltophilia TaxID=40324 RepID=UPI00296FE23D
MPLRKLTLAEHISLDGVIEFGPDAPAGDWSAPYRTAAGLEAVSAAYGEHFDLVLGRRTYDLWSSFWPTAPSSPMADRLNAATKYVVTHRPETLRWGPYAPLGPRLVDALNRLKNTGGPDLIVAGSSTLTSTLIEHGLADELILVVYPILLGAGKRILAEGTPPRSFEPISSRTFPSGVSLS